MPQLKKPTVERIYLPSTQHEENEEDRAWIEVKSKLVLDDVAGMIGKETDGFDSTKQGIVSLISDWNYTDEAGEKLPITVDTVGLIDFEDFNVLTDKLSNVLGEQEALTSDEKKASINTSTQRITVLS